jgi:hypothetical protein
VRQSDRLCCQLLHQLLRQLFVSELAEPGYLQMIAGFFSFLALDGQA